MGRTLILSSERVQRIVRRLAYEVIEQHRGSTNIEIFGIRQGGVELARALAGEITAREKRTFDVHPLDVTPYRDDRDWSTPVEAGDVGAPEVSDRDVILVDDVLFTGRTIRAALDAIIRLGRPRSIQLMVLVDRGHREYPIQPDYVGRIIKTKHKERITVEL